MARRRQTLEANMAAKHQFLVLVAAIFVSGIGRRWATSYMIPIYQPDDIENQLFASGTMLMCLYVS